MSLIVCRLELVDVLSLLQRKEFRPGAMRRGWRMDDCQDLLVDERTWRLIQDPDAADSIARGLFILKEAIDGGPEGAKEASEIILANIEAAYLHTHAHRAAFKLYLLYLTGQLKPEDEPLRLISGAIKRGVAQISLTKKGRGGQKRRR
jgi:hypothetical protein